MIRSLLAPRDVELAVGAVREVAAVEPSAGKGDGGGGFRLLEVARGLRGAAEDETAHRTVGHVVARLVHDPHLVLGQRRAHGDEAQRALVVRAGGRRPPFPLEGLARHAIDRGPAAHRREGEGHRALGQAVDRHQRLAPEAVAREAAREALERRRVHGLRAVQRAAPGGEVQSLEGRVGDLAHAQLVGEVGRGGERGPALVDRPQPALGPREEREGALDGDGQALVQAEEPGADEPHVVVEGQPARAHVGRDGPRGPRAIARMFASRLSWVSSTPLGLPVLPDVYWMKAGSLPPPSGPETIAPVATRSSAVVTSARDGTAGLQHPRDGPRARDVTSVARPRVGEDRGLPRRVLLQAVEAERAGRWARGWRPRAGCPGTRAGSRARWGA